MNIDVKVILKTDLNCNWQNGDEAYTGLSPMSLGLKKVIHKLDGFYFFIKV